MVEVVLMDSFSKLQNAIKELSSIPDELIEKLYAICDEQVIKKGEYFIRAGEVPKHMGLLWKYLV